MIKVPPMYKNKRLIRRQANPGTKLSAGSDSTATRDIPKPVRRRGVFDRFRHWGAAARKNRFLRRAEKSFSMIKQRVEDIFDFLDVFVRADGKVTNFDLFEKKHLDKLETLCVESAIHRCEATCVLKGNRLPTRNEIANAVEREQEALQREKQRLLKEHGNVYAGMGRFYWFQYLLKERLNEHAHELAEKSVAVGEKFKLEESRGLRV